MKVGDKLWYAGVGETTGLYDPTEVVAEVIGHGTVIVRPTKETGQLFNPPRSYLFATKALALQALQREARTRAAGLREGAQQMEDQADAWLLEATSEET